MPLAVFAFRSVPGKTRCKEEEGNGSIEERENTCPGETQEVKRPRWLLGFLFSLSGWRLTSSLSPLESPAEKVWCPCSFFSHWPWLKDLWGLRARETEFSGEKGEERSFSQPFRGACVLSLVIFPLLALSLRFCPLMGRYEREERKNWGSTWKDTTGMTHHCQLFTKGGQRRFLPFSSFSRLLTRPCSFSSREWTVFLSSLSSLHFDNHERAYGTSFTFPARFFLRQSSSSLPSKERDLSIILLLPSENEKERRGRVKKARWLRRRRKEGEKRRETQDHLPRDRIDAQHMNNNKKKKEEQQLKKEERGRERRRKCTPAHTCPSFPSSSLTQ